MRNGRRDRIGDTEQIAPSSVTEQPLQERYVFDKGRHTNRLTYAASATRGTPKCAKNVATLKIFARFARTAAGTETSIFHRNLIKDEVFEATLPILSTRRTRRGLHGSVLPDR